MLSQKLRVFVAGVRYAVRNDRNVAFQMLISLAVLIITFGLRSWFDFVLVLVVTGQMVIIEMINTAIEAICDYIQPEYEPRIGVVKDVAAAASGIAILMWIGTMIYEGFRIWSVW